MGDLIVAIDLDSAETASADAARALVGTVLEVEVRNSSALLLHGALSKTALARSNRG